MNIIETLADNEVVTVRGLVNKHQRMLLKQGLIDSGVAADNHQLRTLRDEMLITDEEGNILFMPHVNGIYFEEVTVRTPANPAKGYIIANLKDTKMVRYNPISAIQLRKDEEDREILEERIENNVLYFYRSDHPDTMPFMSISPLWLAVPAFQNLLSMFSEGDYSALDEITSVREPKCNITALIPLSTRQKYPQNVFPAYFENQIA